jgi:hypothetical protein
MHVTIFGKRYRLSFVRQRSDYLGKCDPPAVRGKTIRIVKGLSEEETLDVIIHEILHAADWHKTEEWVDQVATDLAKILWRLGYRRKEEDMER